MRYFLYYLKKFWFAIVIGIMVLVFVIFARKRDLLNAYTGGSSDYTVTTEEQETETEVEMEEYRSGDLALSMQIPKGWEKVTKDGYDTFIHAPSASSIQVQVLSYYPQVNNATAESVSEDLLSRGYSMMDFGWSTPNSYLATYQSETSAGVMDYIDYTIWDLSHVVKFHATVQDVYFNRLKESIFASLDSLVWDYEDPVPENICIYYILGGDFQFGVPLGWTTGEQDGSLYAYDEATGASMSVSMLTDQEVDINSLTQVDYANFAANGKNNFILSRFEKGADYIYAEANYSVNNTMMGMMQYYSIVGSTHYILSFELPYDVIDQYYNTCYSCMEVFRTFGTQTDEQKAQEKEEQKAAGSGIQDDGINDLLGDVPISTQDTFQEPASEAATDAVQEEASAQQPSEGNNSAEASTFADALVQTTGIPQDKAAEISAIWDSLNAGFPTYAQAVKESATSYIVYITTESNAAYYMSVQKDGTLEWIRANTEDGPAIFGQ